MENLNTGKPKFPVPSLIGQEFVRQYYTLLNRAPEVIYKFYDARSSYVHGGTYRDGEPELPSIGRSEIHSKIMSLGFRDCRTKIRQVDAHESISNSVVVQVTGEISNRDRPLRRFMQTFVLAPQDANNPYKYYVYNDIFRYQDEVFCEGTDGNWEVQTESESQRETPAAAPTASTETADPQEVVEEAENVINNGAEVYAVLTNGVEETPVNEASQECEKVEDGSTAEATTTSATTTSSVSDVTPEPEVKEEMEVAPVTPKTPQSPPEVSTTTNFTEPEPAVFLSKKSWAELAKTSPKKSSSPPSRPPAPVKAVVMPSPSEVVTETSPAANPEPKTNHRNHRSNHSGRLGGNFTSRDDDNHHKRTAANSSSNSTQTRYPDAQQIFVGNLTNEITEADLKNHFSDYGTVLEARINQSHSNTPNFGFVIFEDTKTVQHVLKVLPNQIKRIRMNIEEKKQRNRDNGNRRMGSGDYSRKPGNMIRRNGGMRDSGRRERQQPREGANQKQNYNGNPRR